MTDPVYIGTRAAAKALGVHPSWLEHRRRRGEGPTYVRIGERIVRYSHDDLRAFMERHVVELSR